MNMMNSQKNWQDERIEIGKETEKDSKDFRK